MNLAPYIEGLRSQLGVAAAAGGDDARELADRLSAPLESAAVVMLLEALSAAADEITAELAPGSVEVRLRGREPTFAVTRPPAEGPADDWTGSGDPSAASLVPKDEGGATSRINLRLPDSLKQRVEVAAGREGLSVNAWLLRATAAALDSAGGPPADRRSPHGGDHYTGWVR